MSLWRASTRLWLIVLVLGATVYAQAESFGAEGESHHASQHCCGLCPIGPAPVLPAAATAIVAPVFSPVWLAANILVLAPRQALVRSASSRAPPA